MIKLKRSSLNFKIGKASVRGYIVDSGANSQHCWPQESKGLVWADCAVRSHTVNDDESLLPLIGPSSTSNSLASASMHAYGCGCACSLLSETNDDK